jgi:hypothetical protein
MLKDNLRRHYNNPEIEENRGRKRIIGAKELKTMEGILKEHGFLARAFTWEQLAYEAGIKDQHQNAVSGKTVKHAIGRMDYHKCIICKKGWVNKSTAKDRVKYLEVMLKRYPKP